MGVWLLTGQEMVTDRTIEAFYLNKYKTNKNGVFKHAFGIFVFCIHFYILDLSIFRFTL